MSTCADWVEPLKKTYYFQGIDRFVIKFCWTFYFRLWIIFGRYVWGVYIYSPLIFFIHWNVIAPPISFSHKIWNENTMQLKHTSFSRLGLRSYGFAPRWQQRFTFYEVGSRQLITRLVYLVYQLVYRKCLLLVEN